MFDFGIRKIVWVTGNLMVFFNDDSWEIFLPYRKHTFDSNTWIMRRSNEHLGAASSW